MKRKLRAPTTRKTVEGPAKKAARSKMPKRASAVKKTLKRGRTRPSAKASQVAEAERTRGNKLRKTAAVEDTIQEFRMIVNLEAVQLERWLATPQSKKLEHFSDDGLAADVGQKILKILCKRPDKYGPDDLKQMRVVIDHVKARLTKRPKGDIVASNWRYSLMNWGHDPSRPLKRIKGGKGNER